MKQTVTKPPRAPKLTSAALQRIREDPELGELVTKMGRLVDKNVGRWITDSSIELLEPHDDPESWMILVVRRLSLPVQQVIELSLQTGRQLTELLESGSGLWLNPKWSRVSFVVESSAESGPS
ncbi:MAG: hypothetical protein HYY01_11220 [Chloroflexi bacterium]|nr:hypothetical protein [Chloroflexota bacterium]